MTTSNKLLRSDIGVIKNMYTMLVQNKSEHNWWSGD